MIWFQLITGRPREPPRFLLTASSVHDLTAHWTWPSIGSCGAGGLVRAMIRGSHFLACRQHLYNHINLPWRSGLRVFLCCVSHTLNQAATPARDEYVFLGLPPASKMQMRGLAIFKKIKINWRITYFILLFFSGLRPKRTLRLVLWTAEEQGGIGAFQYYQLHKVRKQPWIAGHLHMCCQCKFCLLSWRHSIMVCGRLTPANAPWKSLLHPAP